MICPYCQGSDTVIFYTAEMPNILSACPVEMLPSVKRHPFSVRICQDCLLGFNSARLGDDDLREIYDHYLYISPSRGIGHSKYDGMTRTLGETFAKNDRIVEVGCSEGYLLGQLKDQGYESLTGIEPGPQADETERRGIHVIRSYFDDCQWPEGSVDGFYLMHVFEHFPDPFEVLATMGRALSPEGSIVVEVPNFEGFHHQHLYFYSQPFLHRLAREKNLKIVRVEKDADILRVVFAHAHDSRPEVIDEKEDVLSEARHRQAAFTDAVDRLRQLLTAYAGQTLHWWGAGSQSVVCLNQVDPTILSKVNLRLMDGDEKKWGCYIPGPNLKVEPYRDFGNTSVDCLVIASQFQNEIRETMKRIGFSASRVEVFN